VKQRGWRLGVKRTIDVTGASIALALASPVIAAVAVAIRLTMGRRVLFRHVRPGRGGQPIEVLKFRTMKDTRDPSGRLLPDQERLTAAGRLLRSLALDELPQLWNVVRGDMSLVGPRPLRTEYLELYTPEQARRHEVLPGITGWAQVNGRNALPWEERFALDVWYVDHWSLGLDLRILLRTPGCVLRRIGVSAPGHATMPDFQGSRTDA
jgi:lipopolysaccharide/colanic/teichoic acid biosynthesis glycosyltransferase